MDALHLGERTIEKALKLLVEKGYASEIGTRGEYALRESSTGVAPRPTHSVRPNVRFQVPENALPEQESLNTYSEIDLHNQKEVEVREVKEEIMKKDLPLSLEYSSQVPEFNDEREGGEKIREEKSPEEYIQEQPELEALWVQWTEIMEFTAKSKIRGPQAQAFLDFQSVGALTRALADTRQNFDGLQLPFKYLTARYDEQVKLEPTLLKGSGAGGGASVAGELNVQEGQRWLSKDPSRDQVFIVDALIRGASGKVVQAESCKDGKLSLADLTRDYTLATPVYPGN
jgi:hypothetical protein